MHFPPQIWEENRGASYSPNVAYLVCYRISALKDVIKYFTTFFASNFFNFYFPPLKPRCILWFEKYRPSQTTLYNSLPSLYRLAYWTSLSASYPAVYFSLSGMGGLLPMLFSISDSESVTGNDPSGERLGN